MPSHLQEVCRQHSLTIVSLEGKLVKARVEAQELKLQLTQKAAGTAGSQPAVASRKCQSIHVLKCIVALGGCQYECDMLGISQCLDRAALSFQVNVNVYYSASCLSSLKCMEVLKCID